jgi:putative peptidoglycan lipid II flippase
LTTPVPDSGSSERGRGRDGHQRGDGYWEDQPLFDDTGWHPDLSDLSEDDPEYRRYQDLASHSEPSFPPPPVYEGNGTYPGDARREEAEGWAPDRRSGRHARRPGDDQGRPGADQAYPPREPTQRGYYQPERHRDYPGYPEYDHRPQAEPGYEDQPPNWQAAPPGQQPEQWSGIEPQPPHGYAEPGRPGHRDRRQYPEQAPYSEPRQYSEPSQHSQPPDRRDFGEPPQYAPPRYEQAQYGPTQYVEPPPYAGPRDYAGPQTGDFQGPPQAPGAGYDAPRDDRPSQPAQPPRSGPADHGAYRPANDYWSMSDPAGPADPPAPVYEEDLAGQPAFMRHQDPPPIYVDLPGQPYTEQTRILPALWGAPLTTEAPAAAPEVEDKAGPATGSFSIARSSSVMAVGTLASRLTGFLRTLFQVYVLGTLALSNVYNNANTLPNVVYNLALGGILTSVIVPLIVNARKREIDLGEAYNQRMFTLITGALLAITLVATAAAAALVDIYKGHITGPNLHLMVIFAYFFIPQIFFYGMSSLMSAVLNSRGSFAAPMWTPVINNVVVIAVLLMYLVTAGPGPALSKSPHVSGGDVLLLGVGTTLGIAAQTLALIPALRKVGFRWRPRWDFQRRETSEIGRMGGWMFCYIAATQVAFLVTTTVCNDAQPNSGYTAYTYAWQLFQLPYAVVGISVITALLPRMSAHASEGRFRLVRGDFSSGVRLGSVIVVPCSLILAALGPDLALVFLDHGRAGGIGRADYIGVVFAVFCLGLMPYMLFQLQLRVFYALHDSKTPALIGVVTMTLNILANLIALNVLPARDVVAGLGVGFGLANLLGTFLAWRILSRRLRGLDGLAISGALAKMHAAAIPGALFAVTIGMMVTDAIGGGRTSALITVIVGGGGAVLLYWLFGRALRISELASLTGLAHNVAYRFRWPF